MIAAALALSLASSPAFAAAIYVLDTSNDASQGAGPYEQLTVNLTNSTHATLTAIGLGVYTFGDFAVNVNASSFTGSLPTFVARAGDSNMPTYTLGSGNIGAGLGNFSL